MMALFVSGLMEPWSNLKSSPLICNNQAHDTAGSKLRGEQQNAARRRSVSALLFLLLFLCCESCLVGKGDMPLHPAVVERIVHPGLQVAEHSNHIPDAAW